MKAAFRCGWQRTGTATVEDVGLLGEIGGATALTVVAQETSRNGTGVRSTAGSHFAGLVILGGSLPINVPANTRIALPGFDYVVVNEQKLPGLGGKGARSPTMRQTVKIRLFLSF